MARLLRVVYKAVRRALVCATALAVRASVRALEWLELLHWPFVSEALGTVPGTFGWQLRNEVYRRAMAGWGRDIVIHHGSSFFDRRSTLGSHVWVSVRVYIEYAHIADHVLIGPGAVLLAGRRHHRAARTDIPIKLQGNNPLEPIAIGEGAWIGANATVMADVGCHAIVGAGAVVLHPVAPYVVVAGNPARVVRDRRAEATAQHAGSALGPERNGGERL